MSDCPSPFQLEAYFVGETTAEIDAHLQTCEACRAYVQILGAERSEMLNERSAAEFLNEPALAKAFTYADSKSWWRRLFGVPILVPALVTAAALLVWVQSPNESIQGDHRLSSPATEGGGRLVVEESTLLKGRAITLIVERKRGLDVQSFRTDVPVRKDDALSVTLVLAKTAKLSIALQDRTSGKWSTLVSSKAFPSGLTRISDETSQEVTDDNTRGRLVVGTPADIEALIDGREPSKPVVELSIVPEAKP